MFEYAKIYKELKLKVNLILMGIILSITGMSMNETKIGQKTLIYFDEACLYVQGISNIVVGLLCISIGIYMVIKK